MSTCQGPWKTFKFAAVGIVGLLGLFMTSSWVWAAAAGDEAEIVEDSALPAATGAPAASPSTSGFSPNSFVPWDAAEKVRGVLRKIELISKNRSATSNKKKPLVEFVAMPVPAEMGAARLGADALKSRASAANSKDDSTKGVKVAQLRWALKLRFTATEDDLAIVIGDRPTRFSDKKAEVEIWVGPGAQSTFLSVIDPLGNLSDFEVKTWVDPLSLDQSELLEEPSGFWIVGPTFMARSLSREGTALRASEKYSGTYAGVRGIFRKRLFKSFTDRVPGKPKIFADVALTLGTHFTGAPELKGFPLFADGRVTIELFQIWKLRTEAGLGISFLMPGQTSPRAGDVSSYFGATITGRIAMAAHKRLMLTTGINFSLPNSASGASDNLLVTSLLEGFFAGSTPLSAKSFLELRFKVVQLHTSGSIVSSGTFKRNELFLGPELLFIRRF